MDEYEPKLICLSCKFSWGYLTGDEELSRQIKNWVPIICSGKVDTTHILSAFKKGVDGVLIFGCPKGDCHYQDGNIEAQKRVFMLQEVMESQGIERERLKLVLSTDPWGKSISKQIKTMRDSIRQLGPVKLDHRVLAKTAKAQESGKGRKNGR